MSAEAEVGQGTIPELRIINWPSKMRLRQNSVPVAVRSHRRIDLLRLQALPFLPIQCVILKVFGEPMTASVCEENRSR